MTKQYGVVLIGCGYIGEEHLADIYYRENVRMVAAVDTDIRRAEHLARKYGVPAYGTDYRKYIGLPETDIVIIATYVDSHLGLMRDAVAAGCHVLCEKPVAADLAAGEAFFREAAAASTAVMIGHILRCNRSYQKIQELVRGGAIGGLKLIRIIQNHHALEWGRYKRLMQDCPPILDCGVHYMDIMRWISGEEIVSVSGRGCRLDPDAPCLNYGDVQVQLTGGCLGNYESGWSRNLKACSRREFIGERGYIRLTLKEDRVSDREEGDLLEIYHSDTGSYETLNVKSRYKDMYAQFMQLIERIEGRPGNGFTLEDAWLAFMAAREACEVIQTAESVSR